VLIVRRTSQDKFVKVESKAGSLGAAASANQHALKPSRNRTLSPATFLQELSLQPEFVDGVLLGDSVVPEAMRVRGQFSFLSTARTAST
jgi:hypothetical protein